MPRHAVRYFELQLEPQQPQSLLSRFAGPLVFWQRGLRRARPALAFLAKPLVLLILFGCWIHDELTMAWQQLGWRQVYQAAEYAERVLIWSAIVSSILVLGACAVVYL